MGRSAKEIHERIIVVEHNKSVYEDQLKEFREQLEIAEGVDPKRHEKALELIEVAEKSIRESDEELESLNKEIWGN